jgi:hypothetical protein
MTKWTRRSLGELNKRVEIAEQDQIFKRTREIQLLINLVEPDPEFQPLLLTDEASALDVSADSVAEIEGRLEAYFGRPLPLPVSSPLWKLVDALKEQFPDWPDARASEHKSESRPGDA